MSDTRSHIYKGFKAPGQDYLSHKNEQGNESHYSGAAAELDADFLGSSIFEKRKFRRTAKRLRRYAT
jgi:hypothetical protein